MTIDSVKRKLSFHSGTSPAHMEMSLKDEGGRLLAHLTADSRKLGFYSPRDGCARGGRGRGC